MLSSKRLQEIGILALAVMLIQVAVTKWIYPFFGTTTQNLYSITPTTAITSQTFGNKIIGLLSGIIPLNLGSWGSWVTMFIGAFVLLLVGYWVYDQKKILGISLWQGRNISQRIWAILLYGSIALYVLLLLTKWSAVAELGVPLAIGVAVNYAVIALVVSNLAKVKALGFLRI